MGGMMGSAPYPNLKKLELSMEARNITYCRDGYRLTTADGKTRAFWERNLRERQTPGRTSHSHPLEC